MKTGSCELCIRPDKELTFHHLIPRTLHRKKWYKKRYTREELHQGIDTCIDCHKNIHKFITEKEMGKNYNTKELLISHPKVQKFLTWISKR